MNIQISNGKLTAGINPKGAELNTLTKDNKEYIWEGNPDFWGKHSPVLFPIVGTLKNNTYIYKDNAYTLSRHGFARDNEFKVKEQSENRVVFCFASNEETKRSYPFDFELQLIYTLNENSLTLEYVVNNIGNGEMFFSIGAHPAFALPGDFKSYSIQFDVDEPLQSTHLENDLLSDTTTTLQAANGAVKLHQELFANDALIFTSLSSRAITILKENIPYLKVAFADFPHLGIWTKPGAPFLCIEPWQGYSDNNTVSGNITEKPGIVSLKNGDTYRASFEIIIF